MRRENIQTAVLRDDILVCEHCDAAVRRVALARHERARCPCCAAPLYHRRQLSLDATLALALTALVALIIANIYPVMTMNLEGFRGSATFWQAVMALADNHFVAVAAVAAVAGLVAPLMQLGLLLYVCVSLRLNLRIRGRVYALHALRHIRPWSMVEVLLLGALVAIVKLGDLAHVAPGPGLYALLVLMLCVAALVADDPQRLWDWLAP